ncbi:MAG: iron-sulfur cluster repair di-iron protein [Bacteroidia bacterium]|nr:iron-sulfur cluster repair di-iron protein [Bacteroidia bacterium]
MRREELRDKTVAQIVTDHISAAHIFKKHGIDFCCGGGISMAKACEKNDISISTLEKEILDHIASTKIEEDYDAMPLNDLLDRIEHRHHNYVRTTLPILSEYAHKVARVHGHHYPQLEEILHLVVTTSAELLDHLEKEEQILFPEIRKVLDSQKENDQNGTPKSMQSPISELHDEHENAGAAFHQIEKLTDNYTPPEGACNTFRALYHLLEEFENDLHLHVHLENNILFPKAELLLKNTKN